MLVTGAAGGIGATSECALGPVTIAVANVGIDPNRPVLEIPGGVGPRDRDETCAACSSRPRPRMTGWILPWRASRRRPAGAATDPEEKEELGQESLDDVRGVHRPADGGGALASCLQIGRVELEELAERRGPLGICLTGRGLRL